MAIAMHIKGLQKLTLLDYPGHTACTVFTGGCNFRCPFCHNASLVMARPQETSSSEDSAGAGADLEIPEDEFFAFLGRRKGLLDGVCISGGEPTLQPDLLTFMGKIKARGYLVKLDTNGYRPDLLQQILDQRLCDYIAMDIKASPANYPGVSGLASLDFARIKASIELLKHSQLDHEFRTTVVDQLHSAEDFAEIGKLLRGGSKYFLQSYVDSGDCIAPGFSPASLEKMQTYLAIVRKYLPQAELRGL